MLDYISKQLKARMQADEPDPIQEEAQMDEAILECAHLFQELDDLSVEGTEAGSSRPFTKVDIPLEDDVEITNVELNLLDGRVTDIPGDATVQEFEYYGMKDHNYFYQEAYSENSQFIRETDEQYSRRLHAIADQKLAAYKNYCIQEGLFGFDKLSVNDGRVPSRVTLDFGKLNGKDYSVKLVVKFEVDKKNRILKKQLDSIMALQSSKEFETAVQSTALMIFGPKVGIENQDDIWKKVTPIELVVPTDPADKFCVAIGFELEGSDKTEYLEWVAPIKSVKKGENYWQMGAEQKPGKTEGDLENVTSGKITKLHTITKGEAIKQEAYEMELNKHTPNRFYQEAIDFGNPDEAPAADPNATDISFDNPPADGADQPAGDAPAADGSTDAPADGGTENKELVDTNNVSDQIAEKISDETQNDANAEDVNVDGVDSSTDADVSDVDTTDAPTDEELAADLGEDTSNEAAPEDSTETSDLDFDNMTIDELMAQGQEKMKTMTMQQLKDFLQNGPEAASTDVAPDADTTDDVTTEAFVDTFLEGGLTNKSNIKKRISNSLQDMQTHLKKIHEAFSKEDVSKKDIAQLWTKVETGVLSTTGSKPSYGKAALTGIASGIATVYSTPIAIAIIALGMADSFGSFAATSQKLEGKDFRHSVDSVLHYLKIATKSSRGKKAFDSGEINTLTTYYDDIINLKKIVDEGVKTHDVSLKEMDDAIVKVINQYDTVKKIVSSDEVVDNVVNEAFFLTRGNIGKELDIHLRKALGILNSSELEIDELCSEFRKEGKKLNRVVHKASTMKNVFDEKERTQLLKCNHCLTDLMSMLRSDIDPGSIMTVKRMIQAFVSEATGIARMLEKRKAEPVNEYADETDMVQEAAAGAALLNVKNQLSGMLSDAFEFIGGSLLPSFTMKSKEKPEVSIKVTSQGQNVEATPVINGSPDLIHKKKGIAIMRAAQTIADFAKDIVSKFKSK